MSSYLNFYARANNIFIPLGSYSRSSQMYQEINNSVPYEKIRAIKSQDLKDYINDLKESECRIQKMKQEDEQRIQLIMSAANSSLQEKMEYVEEIQANFMEMDALIEEYVSAINTLQVYLDMIDQFRYSSMYFDNNYEHYIYAGVEANGDMESIVGE